MAEFEPAPEALTYRPRLDRVRKPDDPRQWKYALRVVTAPDPTQPRSQEQHAPPIKDQAAEGSCTAHGGTSAAETCQAIAGQPVVPLCRNELYYDERTDEGDFPQDAGASVSDSIDSQLRRGGLHPESAWPYDAKPAEQPPSGFADTPKYLYVKAHQPIDVTTNANAVAGFLTACDNQQPIVIGFDFYEEFFAQFQSKGVIAAKPKSALAGGHEVFSACVYAPPNPAVPDTGKHGLAGFDNSWGLTSPARKDIHPDARAGMLWIPMEALGGKGYVNELRAVVGAASPVPVPAPTPAPAPTPGPTPAPGFDCRDASEAIAIGICNGMLADYAAGRIDYPQASASYGYLLATWQGDGALPAGMMTPAGGFPAPPRRHR